MPVRALLHPQCKRGGCFPAAGGLCDTPQTELVFGNVLFAASGNGAPCKGTLGWALRLTHLF